MGVRFECPAGHKLHVKAELAGKRGICPECGMKFIVPSFSGQRVPEDNGVAEHSIVTTAGPSATSTTTTPPPAKLPPGAPAPTIEAATWFIRPAGGGQFGPADDATFAQWVTEGRVAADSWVWRNGWTDWKAGGEALREFKSRPTASPPPATAASALFESNFDVEEPMPAAAVSTATASAAARIEPTSADARRAEMKRRKQRVQNFSIVLTVVALVMLVVLIVIFSRGDEEPAAAEPKAPAASPPVAVDAAPVAAPEKPAAPEAGVVAE